jgi:uncharacterized protein YlxW (UPF0749 family)
MLSQQKDFKIDLTSMQSMNNKTNFPQQIQELTEENQRLKEANQRLAIQIKELTNSLNNSSREKQNKLLDQKCFIETYGILGKIFSTN